VKREDSALILDGKAEDLLTALGEMERKARDATRRGERTVLFLYYSGHAKNGALRLGDTKVPFESLKSRLAQAPADVRIAVFDACQSGSITRSKGARKAPAFEVESDATRAAKGLVILTSSASDEDSQESDQIGGSYFSNHLASALVGTADKDNDGRISLSEAYTYAYDRTVADTSESAAGAQHPTFSYDLAGNGDVVLTDFGERREGVLFPAAAPAGAYFIVTRGGFVAAEVQKTEGVERRIALKTGEYVVTRRLANKLRVGELTVAAGQIAVIDESKLRDAAFSDDPVKGPGRAILYSQHSSFAFNGTYQSIFDAPTAQGGIWPSSALLGLDYVSHNFFGRGWSLGLDVALGGSSGSALSPGGISAAYKWSELAVGGSLMAEWPEGDFVPFAAVRLSLLLTTKDFADNRFPTQNYYVFTPGLVGGLKYRVTKHWFLTGRTRLQYLPYNVDKAAGFGYAEFATLLGYEL
jgi:hypothetical protein